MVDASMKKAKRRLTLGPDLDDCSDKSIEVRSNNSTVKEPLKEIDILNLRKRSNSEEKIRPNIN